MKLQSVGEEKKKRNRKTDQLDDYFFLKPKLVFSTYHENSGKKDEGEISTINVK